MLVNRPRTPHDPKEELEATFKCHLLIRFDEWFERLHVEFLAKHGLQRGDQWWSAHSSALANALELLVDALSDAQIDLPPYDSDNPAHWIEQTLDELSARLSHSSRPQLADPVRDLLADVFVNGLRSAYFLTGASSAADQLRAEALVEAVAATTSWAVTECRRHLSMEEWQRCERLLIERGGGGRSAHARCVVKVAGQTGAEVFGTWRMMRILRRALFDDRFHRRCDLQPVVWTFREEVNAEIALHKQSGRSLRQFSRAKDDRLLVLLEIFKNGLRAAGIDLRAVHDHAIERFGDVLCRR